VSKLLGFDFSVLYKPDCANVVVDAKVILDYGFEQLIIQN